MNCSHVAAYIESFVAHSSDLIVHAAIGDRGGYCYFASVTARRGSLTSDLDCVVARDVVVHTIDSEVVGSSTEHKREGCHNGKQPRC